MLWASHLWCWRQAQLTEERERSTALEADQREAREMARKQQTIARREAEHLRERLADAEAAAHVSATKTSDLLAQLQVLLLLCLSHGLGILIAALQAPAFPPKCKEPTNAMCSRRMSDILCKCNQSRRCKVSGSCRQHGALHRWMLRDPQHVHSSGLLQSWPLQR